MPFYVVERAKTLHIIADEAALEDFCKDNPSRHFHSNMRQLVGITMAPWGERHEVEGWTILSKLEWIKKEGDTEYVPVNKFALDDFEREIRAQRADMQNITTASVSKLINGKYKSHGKPKTTLGKAAWKRVDPPLDPMRWLDGAHRDREVFVQAESRIVTERTAAAAEVVQNLVSDVWTRCIYMLIDLNRHILAALDRMEASCDIDMS